MSGKTYLISYNQYGSIVYSTIFKPYVLCKVVNYLNINMNGLVALYVTISLAIDVCEHIT